ncbi:RNA polymerase sigma factor [Asticcacaulis sp. YBE204]|uniref:RNA polymerase sigma factor n=1 Tax=Asticcacaulis sp. YBE204 TaxID=1282363 RepID=UPI0003C3ACFC|nr:RNA polymerase sigma factor [Asticcacaulis sp. YBE204]ESQ79303.1 hypothetical protein AEYBE204_09850 [Asticcacaulis sp. YBE204]
MTWLRDVDHWLCNQVMPYERVYLTVASRLTNNREVAYDIVQDAYAEVLGGEGWRAARNPKAFVTRIVYCRSLDWVKRQRIVPMQAFPDYETLVFADLGPDPFQRLSGKEELAAVMAALAKLPRRCREVVTLRRIQDMAPRDIAAHLGITVTTVERHLTRGLAMLTRDLRDMIPPADKAEVESPSSVIHAE